VMESMNGDMVVFKGSSKELEINLVIASCMLMGQMKGFFLECNASP
jgi:hypothetical protein